MCTHAQRVYSVRMLKSNDKNKPLHVKDVLLLLLTYKRYSGSICDEQSGLNVHPNCSLPSLLAHLQPAGKDRQTDRRTDVHKLKVALLNDCGQIIMDGIAHF